MAETLTPIHKEKSATIVFPPGKRRGLRFYWLLSLVALLALAGWLAWHVLFGFNFHVVIPGRVYRGAQPAPAALETMVKEHGIRTIVNLRGCGDPNDWYLRECRSVHDLGIAQEDFTFSAARLPPAGEIRRLVDVLDHADYPLFLHCRRGSDRTGMASVILLLLQPNSNLADTRHQLSPRFGHVPIGKTGVLDRFFDLYENWLGEMHQEHSPEVFRRWLFSEYQGGWCSARIEEFTPLNEDSRVGQPIGYRVRVRNLGNQTWHMRPGERAGFHLGYFIWEKGRLVREGRAGLFERDVQPEGSVDMTLVIPPLNKAGRYRLLADMVEEQHCWFYQAGSEPREVELIVRE